MDCGNEATERYFSRCRRCLRALRIFLYRSQSRRCGICADPLTWQRWNLDHIVPPNRGGTNREDNLQLVHPACNYWKGNDLVPPKT